MAIDSQHPKYVRRFGQMKKCRDAYEGEDAIKDAGSLYLPKLLGQKDDEYRAYKQRALFYSITSKTVSALVGMAGAKFPKIQFPDSMSMYFEGAKVVQFSEVFATVLSEVLLQSRCGIMVDMPQNGGSPYPVIYLAEDIINWKVDEQGVLQFVMLRESYEEDNDDGYVFETKIRYRELRIDRYGEYIQVIHYDDADSREETKPLVLGKPMKEIPFIVVHPFGTGFTDYKPLMLDIANINISHYMSSADLEHGRHFTGLPTPIIIGAESDTALYIGSTKFLVIPDKGGDAKYLEFTGQGLASLEKAMTEKQGLLATLSARLLDNSSRGSEASDAVKLRYSSETASLTTVVKAVETGLNVIYKTISEVLKEGQDAVNINLDTDFLDSVISAADMSALFDGYFKGAISKETLVFNMRKGKRLDPDRTNDDELKAIEEASVKTAEAAKTATTPITPVVQ